MSVPPGPRWTRPTQVQRHPGCAGQRRPGQRAGHRAAAGPDLRRPDPVLGRAAAAASRTGRRPPAGQPDPAGQHPDGRRQHFRAQGHAGVFRSQRRSGHRQLRPAREGGQPRRPADAGHVRACGDRRRRAQRCGAGADAGHRP
ncbi:hypothetical protein G6F57_020221 [Rhizopus arrhizus]|nr:hypothetical protein G6F57_020221 [Rhizopus arrhizus]